MSWIKSILIPTLLLCDVIVWCWSWADSVDFRQARSSNKPIILTNKILRHLRKPMTKILEFVKLEWWNYQSNFIQALIAIDLLILKKSSSLKWNKSIIDFHKLRATSVVRQIRSVKNEMK